MRYSDSPVIDTTPQTEFAHQLLLAWAAWVYGCGKLGYRASADVLNMPISELRGHKNLTEEQLIAIDRAIARMPSPMQRLINVHYRSSEDEPMTLRYARLGCSRLEYRTHLQAVHASLYALLLPAVDQWRHSTV